MSDKPHSPLPWEAGQYEWEIRDPNDSIVTIQTYAGNQNCEADRDLIITAVNAYHALLARNTELEDLISRMCHDESGLVEAGRRSERAACLAEIEDAFARIRNANAVVEVAAAMERIRQRGDRVLLPPDVTSRRLAVYEEALEGIANTAYYTHELRAKAREALEKGKST